MSSATIAVLPGDGVGPEVTSQALSALLAVEERFGHDFTFVERPVGLDAILSEGVAISEETVQACRESDAILFGAIGSLSDDMAASRDVRPEQALFVLRSGFDFYANLRPVRTFVSMEQSSPLRPERISGTDLMFVRELSAGLYYGFAESTDHKPSEIRQYDGGLEAIDTLLYTEAQIERVVRVAFDIARAKNRPLASIDKANVLSSSLLWRRVVDTVADEYPDVAVTHMLVDAAAMRLMLAPSGFGVLVTENLFGDILTDEASVLTGSIGMLPSASLGARATQAGLFGLYEPVHGSAPDIAGQNVANPVGAILSAAMLLRHSLGLEREATEVELAVGRVLDLGCRTPDIAGEGSKVVGTREMGESVCDQLLHPTQVTS